MVQGVRQNSCCCSSNIMDDNDFFSVVYHLTGTEPEARSKAEDICYEETVEFPPDLIPSDFIKSNVVGKIKSFKEISELKFEAEIQFNAACAANEITQLLTLIYGNISMKNGICVKDVRLSDSLLKIFKGPRFGIDALRQKMGIKNQRPLLATALKPMGLSSQKLAEYAHKFAVGGIDIVKDDHGLTNQKWSEFVERVRLCSTAVAKANQITGKSCIYVANITAPNNEVRKRARVAKAAGAGGFLISPFVTGIDMMKEIAEDDSLGLPILAHPALLGSFVQSQDSGISHFVLFGKLMRLCGADGVIYPNFGGRFTFTEESCGDIVKGCAVEMGHIKSCFPAPGGGLTMDMLPQLTKLYGNNVIYLVGAGLFRHSSDLIANSKYFSSIVCSSHDESVSVVDGVGMDDIELVAHGIRRRVLEHTINNKGGYLSQACSSAEIFASLYTRILNIGMPRNPIVPAKFPGVPSQHNKHYSRGNEYNGPTAANFDRFIMSPSQYSLVLYAALVETGRMSSNGLLEFNKDGGVVEMIGAEHSPGLEIMSGSLGQGISQAAGIAHARKLKKEKGRVIMLMSDGEFQVGQTWESIQAMSFHELSNVVIYVDVNGYQCDGCMDDVMAIEPLDMRLEAFGARVLKVDGHEISALLNAGLAVPNETRPTVVLCSTCPWKGLDIIKSRVPKFHYVRFKDEEERELYRKELKKQFGCDAIAAVNEPKSRAVAGKGKPEVLTQVHRKNMVKWAKDKPNVIVLSADLTSSVEIDLFRDTYPDRFLSMGVAEQNMVSYAGGLAREGFIPFVHTFGVFIYRRAFDQVAMSVAYPNLPVRLLGFLPGITTPGGATHQATEDIDVMRSLPNMTILEVGDATEVESVLDATIDVPGPVYIRMLRGEIPRLFSDDMVVGKSRHILNGSDVVIISSGICTEEAMRAASALKYKDISLGLIHVHTLKPFDDETVFSAIADAKFGVITVENHSIMGGLGSIVSDSIVSKTLTKKPLVKLGLQDVFAHGASRNYLMREYGIDALGIVRAIEKLMNCEYCIQSTDLTDVRIEAVHSLAKAEAL